MKLRIILIDVRPQVLPAGVPGQPVGTAVGIPSEEYRVILHQDSWHEVPSVAGMLTEVIGALEGNAALAVATQAFEEGQAVVIACSKQKALLYRKQLILQYQLIVTLEAVV